MQVICRPSPTIGFLSTWPVYQGTTLDPYARTLLRGVCAAAHDHRCRLLLGCGIGRPTMPRGSPTAWSAPGPTADFVPVGPWNTDGLVIAPDDLSASQSEYLQDLIRSGFPVVLTTPDVAGPTVCVDNAGGIRQAIQHLVEHGHHRIAYIAGKSGRGGDSAERLAAYRATVRELGLEEDERLIAFGEHRREDGGEAMRRILASGAPFSAVVASNDLSALGALDVLRQAQLRVPEDVAVIGFDAILDARSHRPPLTTIRHPTFNLGCQAVVALLSMIEGKPPAEVHRRVPTHLIVRQTCGCRPKDTEWIHPSAWSGQDPATDRRQLARIMAEAVLLEADHLSIVETEEQCLKLIEALVASLRQHESVQFDAALLGLMQWLQDQDEEAYAWHAAFSTLRGALPDLLRLLPDASPLLADALIDEARLEIAEHAQRQATDALLRYREASNRLGMMTSQLLTTLNAEESAAVLTRHLARLGVQHALMALYVPENDDPYASAVVLLKAGAPQAQSSSFTSSFTGRFATRAFPPCGLYDGDEPVQLAVLPVITDDLVVGFAALSASSLDSCAAIVRNLAAAMRTSRLYQEAIEGRRLAEEASRLKSRFLSMVGHELRIPLSLIVGLSDMVANDQRERGEVSATTLRDLMQINASAQHLARLIGDVLDLASSEAGQLRILREPLDLAEVLRVPAALGEQMALEKGLQWQADLPAQGPWVTGDRTRLRQVALNLISNAVKFTETGRVVLAVRATEAEVSVAVSDTGLGVAPDDQALLFREFQRAERTVQLGYGGMGLGLAITKHLVEHHGGVISMASPGELGVGSTFRFTLPILASAPQPGDIALPAIEQPNCVVVLADVAQPGASIVSHLGAHGFVAHLLRIDQSADWPAQVAATAPLAVVLDSDLALRQGWSIIGLLKGMPATAQLPVLIYALDAEEDQGGLVEIDYRLKPLRADQLAQELARCSAPETRQRTVLVVDDDPGILDLHCRLVEQAGCRALRARHGREALDVLAVTRPDLILLDLMMPVMDGFAVLEALRANAATRDIPVVVLTAHVLSDADVERCNRGVAAILSKGLFDAGETLRHIEAALARQRSLGSPTQQLVRRAMAFIQANYAQPLNREEIAGHVGISPDYLTDCFRQELSVTPITYLNRYRLLRARELLESTDLKIAQVAQAVGFTESAHFTRTFQREVGVAPRAYRQGQRAPVA